MTWMSVIYNAGRDKFDLMVSEPLPGREHWAPLMHVPPGHLDRDTLRRGAPNPLNDNSREANYASVATHNRSSSIRSAVSSDTIPDDTAEQHFEGLQRGSNRSTNRASLLYISAGSRGRESVIVDLGNDLNNLHECIYHFHFG